MISRQMERLGGLFIATVSIAVTIWTWQSAINTGSFLMAGAICGPAFTVIGLGTIAVPTYRRERLQRGEDITQLSGYALITPRWWGIQAIGFGCGLINLALLKGWF
jgi:hypothetical protein